LGDLTDFTQKKLAKTGLKAVFLYIHTCNALYHLGDRFGGKAFAWKICFIFDPFSKKKTDYTC